MIETDPDVTLLAAIARGDPGAARRLVAAKLPRVTALGVRLLGSMHEAEEVAQEAFLRCWAIAPKWQAGAARFDTWLHTVVLNLCRDRLRRRREVTMPVLPERTDPAPLADCAIETRQRGQAVADAVAALPERQREAIVLGYYQGLTNIEAAHAMAISVEALESLLSRARRSLRERLAGGHDEV